MKSAQDSAEIDQANPSHQQSEAALGSISPKPIDISHAKHLSKEPLMPSKDASKLDLSGDLPFSS